MHVFIDFWSQNGAEKRTQDGIQNPSKDALKMHRKINEKWRHQGFPRGAQDGPKMDHFRHPAPKGRPKGPQGAKSIGFGSKIDAKNGPKINEKLVFRARRCTVNWSGALSV